MKRGHFLGLLVLLHRKCHTRLHQSIFIINNIYNHSAILVHFPDPKDKNPATGGDALNPTVQCSTVQQTSYNIVQNCTLIPQRM